MFRWFVGFVAAVVAAAVEFAVAGLAAELAAGLVVVAAVEPAAVSGPVPVHVWRPPPMQPP